MSKCEENGDKEMTLVGPQYYCLVLCFTYRGGGHLVGNMLTEGPREPQMCIVYLRYSCGSGSNICVVPPQVGSGLAIAR